MRGESNRATHDIGCQAEAPSDAGALRTFFRGAASARLPALIERHHRRRRLGHLLLVLLRLLLLAIASLLTLRHGIFLRSMNCVAANAANPHLSPSPLIVQGAIFTLVSLQ
jgi:hypothetical protein